MKYAESRQIHKACIRSIIQDDWMQACKWCKGFVLNAKAERRKQ